MVAVRDDGMSNCPSGMQPGRADCGVAKSTLADRFRGKSSTRGRPRTFNQEEEEILVDLLIRCSEIGIAAPSTA